MGTAVALTIAAATVIIVGWMGATGEAPWGFNADDHWPIWRQYLMLSAVVLAALTVLIASLPSDVHRRRRARGWFRRVGVGLCTITILWAVALVTFAFWGSVSLRGLTSGLASTAPGLALSTGILTLGYTRQRWLALVGAVLVLLVGGLATALTFTSR